MEAINYILRHDRLKHFFVGTLIFLFISLFLDNTYALLITAIIAVLKEVYDKYKKKTMFDLLDIIYTILTAIIITYLWK